MTFEGFQVGVKNFDAAILPGDGGACAEEDDEKCDQQICRKGGVVEKGASAEEYEEDATSA